MTDVADRLLRITEVTREHVLTTWNVDSCIASTRVLIQVLDYFGYHAEPMAVRLAVFTRQGWDMAERGVPNDEWPDEAWSVGIEGSGAHSGKRWDGHLVASLETDGQRFMLDPSMDQLTRPARNIRLVPSLFGVPDDWLTEVLRFVHPVSGLVICYTKMDDTGSWRSSPDWSERHKTVRDKAGAAIRQLKREL